VDVMIGAETLQDLPAASRKVHRSAEFAITHASHRAECDVAVGDDSCQYWLQAIQSYQPGAQSCACTS
jgi:hypothetical protein